MYTYKLQKCICLLWLLTFCKLMLFSSTNLIHQHPSNWTLNSTSPLSGDVYIREAILQTRPGASQRNGTTPPGTNSSPCNKHASSMQCGAAESGWAHTLLNRVLDLTWSTFCYSMSSIWKVCVTVNKMASLDIVVIFILGPLNKWWDVTCLI
jgi:hypothetical protein